MENSTSVILMGDIGTPIFFCIPTINRENHPVAFCMEGTFWGIVQLKCCSSSHFVSSISFEFNRIRNLGMLELTER